MEKQLFDLCHPAPLCLNKTRPEDLRWLSLISPPVPTSSHSQGSIHQHSNSAVKIPTTLYNSKEKSLGRQITADKHHCDFGSHSEVSENHWNKSSSPFPSLCQEFHSTAFLIMSMNKTPAFSDTSNTALHLLLYWHFFKVSARYKKTTLLLPAHTIGSWVIRSATEEGKKTHYSLLPNQWHAESIESELSTSFLSTLLNAVYLCV